MNQRQQAIATLLKDLRKASKLIDSVATQSQSVEDLDRESFVHGVAAALCQLFDLESDLFDLEPDLTFDHLKPSIEPLDFEDALDRLLSQNPAIYQSTVREFTNHMTADDASQMLTACQTGTEYEFAQAWWERQKKPFIPIAKIYKDLRHERRYCRYQAAKLLEQTFGMQFWDVDRTDVALEVADTWFQTWLTGQRYTKSTPNLLATRMSAFSTQTLTLEDFLKLPHLEESPAWEYVNGIALQKPMPKTRHAILQKRLLNAIDQNTEIYTALPELRCTFGGRSIVPDIAVVAWQRIPVNEAGEPEDDFTEAPDWTIEILSPSQTVNRVIDNILHCLQHGCQLGWMLDPDDYSILLFTPHQEPQVCRGRQPLLVLEEINLVLTAEQVFEWLKINRRS